MSDVLNENQIHSETPKIITLTTIIIGIILIILNLFYTKEEFVLIKQILLVGVFFGLGYIAANAIGTDLKRDISFTIAALTLSIITIYLLKKIEYQIFPLFISITFLFFIIFCLGVMIKKNIIDKKTWNIVGYFLIILIIIATIYYGASTGEFPVPY